MILTVIVQENKSPKKSHSVHRRRHLSATEREEQERIDRENRILLRKILEQHHGLRRSSSIPPPQAASRKNDLKKQRQIDLNWKISKQTSNQVKNLVKQGGLGRCPSQCKPESCSSQPHWHLLWPPYFSQVKCTLCMIQRTHNKYGASLSIWVCNQSTAAVDVML